MTKKIVFYFSIFILIIINVLIDININNYINVINKSFHKSISLSNFYYYVICFIIALITVLFIIAIKLVVFYKKDEIKGIKLKSEDGTYGTAEWLNNKEIDKILGRNNTQGIILGKKNNDIIKLPFNSHFNKNIAVFGSSGSMKTIRVCFN